MPDQPPINPSTAYSGYAHGAKASPDVASKALQHALGKRGVLTLSGHWRIWLLLTPHFQHCIAACVDRVARESGSLNVVGCLANGVFSDDDWSLDSPGAVVLLEPSPVRSARWRLTLAAPNALEGDWKTDGKLRLGGIAGDATGSGPYCLWQGRHISAGRIDLPSRQPRWLLADGFTPDGPRHRVSASRGLSISGLNGMPALPQLTHWLKPEASGSRWQGARWQDAAGSSSRWLPLIGREHATNAILLAGETSPGDQLTWGHQDANLATERLQRGLARMFGKRKPAYALAFASQHGGAYAGSGTDPFWQAMRTSLAGVPFAGFYGNGQLAPLAKGLQVLDNSVLVVLFD